MAIKFLLADDSSIMRSAIRQVLSEDPSIKLVAVTEDFTGSIKAVADFSPEVLLLDLPLPGKDNHPPAFGKLQLASVPRVLAISISNDAAAKALSESYGAVALSDKMRLYQEMIPAIINRRGALDG